MPYDSKAFGVVLSRLRARQNISQERFAISAEIARSHLTELENGKKVPRLDTLFRLAEALEMRPSELLRLAEEEMGLRQDR